MCYNKFAEANKYMKVLKIIIKELIAIMCIGLLLYFNTSYLLFIFAIFSIIVLIIDSVFNNENKNINKNIRTFIIIILCLCIYTILYTIYGGIQI